MMRLVIVRLRPAAILITALAGVLILAAPPAAAQLQSPGRGVQASGQPPVVVLRSHIVVTGPRVTIGDMFAGAGKAGDQVFAAAPAPGTSAYFLSGDVYAATEAAGLVWRPDAAVRAIKVTRAGRAVPETAMRRAIRAALGDKASGLVDLQIASTSLRLEVATDDAPTVRATDVNFDPQSGHFSATLVAPASAPDGQSLRVYGRLVHLARIPTLRNPIVAGQVISASDIGWLKLPRAEVSPNVVTSGAALVGMAARDSLAPGRPILASDVQKPILVSRGALVSMTLALPNMVLTAIGKALVPGGLGDMIEVQNTQSLKIVAATVTGPNEVSIVPRAPSAPLQSASLN